MSAAYIQPIVVTFVLPVQPIVPACGGGMRSGRRSSFRRQS